MSKNNYKNWLYPISIISVIALLNGCSGSSSKSSTSAAGATPEVSVIEAKPSNMELYTKINGRLEATEKAEVRARTPGVITRIYFTEGSYVKKGSPLFSLDDTPVRAQVAQAQAQYAQAAYSFNKISPLLKPGAVSKADYDNALTSMQAAKAALDAAKVSLSYANITAPISGKIGRSYQTVGALVGQSDYTLLAVIQNEDSLKVNLNQSVSDYTKLNNFAQTTQGGIQNLPFDVILEDGSFYPEQGKILFSDASVDETTGQVVLKGLIPNDNKTLLPGMFVNVRVKIGEVQNIITIPIVAVTQNESGGTVIVVNKDGTYESKQITIKSQDDKYVYVSEGLNNGDLILVDGQMKLMTRPAKVKAKIVNQSSESSETSKNNVSSTVNSEQTTEKDATQK